MPGEAVDIINPLPQRYLTTEPGLGGVIKQRPEDFLVEEAPLYEPCGEGEHLYLRVEKTGVSHHEMVSCLRRHFNVPDSAIGFAGMKDKVAVTGQTVSIHLPKDRAVPAGDLPAAESAYRRALARVARDERAAVGADILNNLGRVLERQGELSAALRFYRRALRWNPGQGDARANLRRLGAKI